jgi:hypothetical protein
MLLVEVEWSERREGESGIDEVAVGDGDQVRRSFRFSRMRSRLMIVYG